MRVVRLGKITPEDAFIWDERDSAMGGDIMNALVEFVTNPDDSYRDMEDAGQRPSGKIRIEICRRRSPNASIVTVKDQAEGMSVDEMEARLTRPGAPTSGFEAGRSRRGLFGRGAKDVVEFGTTTFTSVKDGEIAQCVITGANDYEISSAEASDERCAQLGLTGGHGTVAAVEVDTRRFRIPHHRQLLEKLSNHYQLRDILNNPRRRVTLVDVNSNSTSQLRYSYPAAPVVLEEEFGIEGYPEARATLRIREHHEPLREDRVISHRPYRQNAILVKTSGACLDNTLFGLENDPCAHWFSGELECDHIDTLIREFRRRRRENPSAQQHPPSNPTQLIDPRRQGLTRSHPFAAALYDEAESRLAKLVEAKRRETERGTASLETDQVRRRLRRFATWASQYLAQKLREVDAELPTGESGAHEDWPAGMTIVPGGPNEYFPLTFETRKTFTVRLQAEDPLPDTPSVVVRSSDPQGVGVVTERATLRKLEDPCRAAGTFQLEGRELNAQAIVTASLNGYEACLWIDVVPATEPPEVPEGLSFEHETYRVPLGQKKRVVLRLRSESLPQVVEAALACDDPRAVRLKRQRITLSQVPNQSYLAGAATVLGRQLDATAVMRARIDDLSASTKLRVVRQATSGPELKFVPVDKDFGAVRWRWDKKNPNLLEIGAQHPGVSRYLGRPEDGFPGTKSPEYMILLAEIVAEALAARVVMETARKQYPPDGRMDVDAFYTEHGTRMREILPKAHEFLVSPPDRGRSGSGPSVRGT